MSFVYQPGVPTGRVKLNQDYLNVMGNFQQLDVVYGTDHYPFSNAVAGQQGFHNQVTTPAYIANPTTGLPPVTVASPIFYAFQQYPALGVLQYSRGPNAAVTTPLTHLNSASTPVILAGGGTTNILDFTGMSLVICNLYATDVLNQNNTVIGTIAWNGSAIKIVGNPASFLSIVSSGNILQLKSVGGPNQNIYWTLQLIRIQ